MDTDCYFALETSIYGHSRYPVSFMYNGYLFKNKYYMPTEESKEEKKPNIHYILVEGYQVNVDSMETVQVLDKDLIKIMEKEGYTVTKNG